MRFSVVTYGSEGDTRPFVALSKALLNAGHEVMLFAEQSCTHIALMHGVPVQPLGGDIKAMMPIENPDKDLSTRELIRTVKAGLRAINGHVESWMSTVASHARSADAILYAGFACPTAQVVAQELGKQEIGLWLQPTTPTREFGSSALPPWRMPGWLNKLSYRASPQSMIKRMYGKSAEAARVKLFGNTGRSTAAPDDPILYGFSRHIVPRPKDWPESHQICGHWPLHSSDWQPAADLLEFLSRGPAPVYVGFGAVSSFVRQRQLTEIIAGLEGRRAVFYPGWSQINASMLPDSVFVIGDTSHDWLFPQMSMVIHHGGAGTTHTGSRAGVPSVVLPFGGDQSFWAGRLASIGVAPPRVARGKWDGRGLAKMIAFAEQPAVRERARSLGAAISQEDGVADAVRRIEEITEPKRRGVASASR